MKITSGIKSRPQKVCLYGPEGVGKTLLAADLPSPIFIDAEGGTDHIDVSRVEVHAMSEIREAVQWLKREKHEFRTVVLDTIDWVEKRLIAELCASYKVDSIEKIDGGYGKGYTILEEQMMQFLGELDSLRKKGMNIVLLAHSQVKKHEDPELGSAYDRYILKLEKKTSSLIKEWVDALLFYRFKTVTAERDTSSHRGIAKGREIATNRAAAFDAKNRHNLPDRITVADNAPHPAAGLDAIFKMEETATPVVVAPVVTKGKETAAIIGAVVGAEPDDDDIPGIPKSPTDADKINALIADAGGQEALDSFLAANPTMEWDDAMKKKALKNPSGFISAVRGVAA
jgi:GTPase SAR1 family protein